MPRPSKNASQDVIVQFIDSKGSAPNAWVIGEILHEINNAIAALDELEHIATSLRAVLTSDDVKEFATAFRTRTRGSLLAASDASECAQRLGDALAQAWSGMRIAALTDFTTREIA